MPENQASSRQIWKFELKPNSHPAIVDMPKGAKVVCVHAQHNKMCLWAEVNPSAATEPRYFGIYGTGHLIHDWDTVLQYIGSVFIDKESFVFHIFEVKK